MTSAIILFAILLAVALTWAALRGIRTDVHTPEQLIALAKPVDLAAFRNLVDPEEDAYLRSTLPPREFGRVLRARRRTALAYIGCLAHNAALLLRLSEFARNSADPAVSAAAHQLADSAIQMRLHCLVLQLRLRVVILVPALPLGTTAIADRYQRFTDSVLYFVGLEDPAFLSRVSAVL